MEHTKKMLLVEPDFIERLKHNDNQSDNVSSRLDEEMQKILKSKKDDREKWALYSQALQRFLHFAETDRRPFKIPIIMGDEYNSINQYSDGTNTKINKKEENPSVSVTNPTLLEDSVPHSLSNESSLQSYPMLFTPSYIIDVIPKSYKRKGQALMDIIIRNKQKIWWRPSGEIVLNNVTVKIATFLIWSTMWLDR